jgi:hypothetical protein
LAGLAGFEPAHDGPIYAKVSQDVLLYLNHNEVLTIQRFSQQYNEWMNAVCFLVFDWLISKKKLLPLKPLCQMNQNLVGSILGRSSIKIIKQELPVVAMFVNGLELNQQSL